MTTYETSGYLVTATQQSDEQATAIDLSVDVPTNTQVDVTVNQDESGGTTADNTETLTDVSSGTQDLSNFSATAGATYWIRFDLSTTDDTVTPEAQLGTLFDATLIWSGVEDWGNERDNTGVAHETVDNTDNTDPKTAKQGYSYETPPLMDGLVGWWPLHEWNGQANDLSGNSNHGSVSGPTQGVAGRGGLTAYGFDGSDDDVSTASTGPITSTPFTVSVWVNTSSPSSYETFVEQYDGSGFWLRLNDIDSDGNWEIDLGIRDGSSTNRVYVDDAGIDDENWHHIVAVVETVSTSDMRLFIDGNEQSVTVDSSQGTTSVSNSSKVWIGYSNANTSGRYEGQLCGVRAYDRILTDTEIQTLYKWGSLDLARPPTDGVSYYPLDGDATDSWGSNDGTVNGATFVSNAIRGQAAEFDGTDDNIDMGDIDATSSMSISCWFNTDFGGSQAFETIVGGAYDGTTYPYLLWLDTDPTPAELRFQSYDGSSHVVSAGTPINGNAWYHVVGLYDNTVGEYRIYVNGVLDGTTSDSVGPSDADNNENDNIGNQGGSGTSGGRYHFSGPIDDVRIYDYALTSSEVFELYKFGTFGRDLRQLTVRA